MSSTFLFSLPFLTLGLLLIGSSTHPALAAESQRPNILVIICDDAGFADFGFQGGLAKTPVLDRLASEGMRFSRAYNNGRCWPTRQSLMTGLNPQLTDRGGAGLGPDCVTIPEVLRKAGYSTYMVGKWHLGMGKKSNPKDTPLGRGFEEFTGALAGANQPTKAKLIESAKGFIAQGKDPMMIYEGDRMLEFDEIPDDFYASSSWSDRGAKMIRQTPKEKPFFLFMSYTAPHWPIHPQDEYVAKYDGMFEEDWEALRARIHKRQIEIGLIPEGTPLAPLPPEAVKPMASAEGGNRQKLIQEARKYYATITEMDEGIGRLLKALEETGRSRNTLLLFLSDNGGEPLIGGAHRAVLSNTPFVGGKVSHFEGGIATPLLAWWPGVIPADSINRTHEVRLEDFMPTALELAGVSYPQTFENRPIFPHQGRSFVPALKDPAHNSGPRIWAWEHDGQLSVWSPPWKAHFTEIRHPVHKQLTDPALGGWSLFDLSNHRIENENLAKQNPEKLAEMVRIWQAWARSVGWKTSPRWGLPEFPKGLEFQPPPPRFELTPADYDPKRNPVGKSPEAWGAEQT